MACCSVPSRTFHVLSPYRGEGSAAVGGEVFGGDDADRQRRARVERGKPQPPGRHHHIVDIHSAPLAAEAHQPKVDDPPAKRLVITSGSKEGLEIELTEEQLTIGRSSDSALVVRDDYTSTHHARLMLWDGQWMVQDLDSTNGTFLAGNRVSVPTPVPLNTPVSVGTTTFELRR